MIRIAIQKSGRLYDDSVELLRKCGLKIDNAKGQLKARIKNYDAEVFFLRNSDIPQYLEDGIVDLAIIGENVITEKQADISSLLGLGFSQCRLSIATPKGLAYEDISSLEGKKIATSYPNTLKDFLAKHDVNAELHIISGSVEIAPNIGLADAICDLVSSGSTLFKNGLVEQEIILRSEAVIAANTRSVSEKFEAIDDILFRVRAVLKAEENRYILFNIPDEKIEKVSSILPVLKSPTVLPLMEEGWSSMHTVINQKDFWSVISQIKQEGAQGILVLPIENMIL
ncbi:MAG: ATP phosphoribosyltransferase [Saprospiraceae bacterium]|mgnify:CR=1 FL=1|jgi:ATP phosphoribosyltransferase|tara:strand:+ start:648 stop:1499 length:852 start_codon:yes stop_codon:yes gene_type:complete